MSRIDELIAKHCPEGVEFKALGQAGTITRGKRFVKADMIETGTPCIHYGEIYTKYGNSASEAISFLGIMSKTDSRTKFELALPTC